MPKEMKPTTSAPAPGREYGQTPIPTVQAAKPGGGTRGQTPIQTVQPPPKK